MSDIFNNYGLRNFYKGTFLKYVDDNYKESDNLNAYIEIPELMLNKGSTIVSKEPSKAINILNGLDLNTETTIDTISSIICKPLYVNHLYPYLTEGETVFVFIIDSDIKKIFYLSCTNDQPINNGIDIRVGYNLIHIDKDEIRLVREMGEEKNDISLVIDKRGIEINSGGNFVVDGHNYKEDVFNK
jgi:hypothetical protein